MELMAPVIFAVDGKDVAVTVVAFFFTLIVIPVGIATWRNQNTGRWVNREWHLSRHGWVRRAQQRFAMILLALAPLGFLLGLGVLMFSLDPPDGGLADWYLAGVLWLFALAAALFLTTVLFGRPRCVIPPAHRGPGVVQELWRWFRDRRSGRGGNSQG